MGIQVLQLVLESFDISDSLLFCDIWSVTQSHCGDIDLSPESKNVLSKCVVSIASSEKFRLVSASKISDNGIMLRDDYISILDVGKIWENYWKVWLVSCEPVFIISVEGLLVWNLGIL